MYIVVGSYFTPLFPYPYQKDLSIILIVIHMTLFFFPERYSSPTIPLGLLLIFLFFFFGYQDSNTVRIPLFVY